MVLAHPAASKRYLHFTTFPRPQGQEAGMKHEVLHVNMGEVSLEIMNENDGNLWQKSKKVQRHHVWSIIQKACCCKDGQHLPTVPSSSSGTPPMYTESSISSADLGTLQLPRWPHLKKKLANLQENITQNVHFQGWPGIGSKLPSSALIQTAAFGMDPRLHRNFNILI